MRTVVGMQAGVASTALLMLGTAFPAQAATPNGAGTATIAAGALIYYAAAVAWAVLTVGGFGAGPLATIAISILAGLTVFVGWRWPMTRGVPPRAKYANSLFLY